MPHSCEPRVRPGGHSANWPTRWRVHPSVPDDCPGHGLTPLSVRAPATRALHSCVASLTAHCVRLPRHSQGSPAVARLRLACACGLLRRDYAHCVHSTEAWTSPVGSVPSLSRPLPRAAAPRGWARHCVHSCECAVQAPLRARMSATVCALRAHTIAVRVLASSHRSSAAHCTNEWVTHACSHRVGQLARPTVSVRCILQRDDTLADGHLDERGSHRGCPR